jgi:hypothetical protein
MAIDLHDQPSRPYHDFDVTDTELSNDQPPHEYEGFRSFGWPEVLSFAVYIVFMTLLIIGWMSS